MVDEETTETDETADDTVEETTDETETDGSEQETTDETEVDDSEQEATETLVMVTDRTEDDVTNAAEIRRKYQNYLAIQHGNTRVDSSDAADLTDESKAILERGCMTITTLNRIAKKQNQVAERLANYGYYTSVNNKTDWTYTDIFKKSDHDGMLKNLDILKESFVVKSTTPATPSYLYQWENANAVEQILVDIDEVADSIENTFEITNTFYCGEE